MFRNRKVTTRVFLYSLIINFLVIFSTTLKTMFFSHPTIIKPEMIIMLIVQVLISFAIIIIALIMPSFILSLSVRPLKKIIDEFEISGYIDSESKEKVNVIQFKLLRNMIIIQAILFFTMATWSVIEAFFITGEAEINTLFWLNILILLAIFTISGLIQLIIFNSMFAKIKAKLNINHFEKRNNLFGILSKLLLLVIPLVVYSVGSLNAQWLNSSDSILHKDLQIISGYLHLDDMLEEHIEEHIKDESSREAIEINIEDEKLLTEMRDNYKRRAEFIDIFLRLSKDTLSEEELKKLDKSFKDFTGLTKDTIEAKSFNETVTTSILSIVGLVIICLVITIIYSRDLTSQVKAIKRKINDMLSGEKDLSQRLNILSIDELADLSDNFNQMLDQQEKQMKEIISEVSEISHSTEEVDKSVNSVETLVNVINDKSNSVNKLATEQNNDIKNTEESISQIVVSITEIHKNVSDQAAFIEESSASMEEMLSSIETVSNSAVEASNISQKLLEIAKEGSKSLSNSTNAIKDIKKASDTVSEIILSINDIAKKTNLLAMNASIEAAHAGSAGRGFAVVAEEIRRLAETSGASAKQIIQEITSMTDLINNGVSLSEKVDKAFKRIFADIKHTTEFMQNIASAMREQNIGANDINKSMTSMVDASEKIKNLADLQKDKSISLSKNTKMVVLSADEITKASIEQNNSVLNIADSIKTLKEHSDSTKNAVKKLSKIAAQYKFSTKEKIELSLIEGKIDK